MQSMVTKIKQKQSIADDPDEDDSAVVDSLFITESIHGVNWDTFV